MEQMASFARRAHGELSVHPLLFETDRTARAWQLVATRSGGRLVRVPGPEAIELALPALVSSRIRSVVARNATSGAERSDLLQVESARIHGSLALVPGANEIELEVQSDRGSAALFRFRVYSAPAQLERWLADLRERNLALEVRAQGLDQAAREPLERSRARALELVPEAVPAAPAALP
jgi:hypothetical protein